MYLKIITLIICYVLSVHAVAQQIRNTYRFYNTLSTSEPDCAEDLIPARGLNIECQAATAATAGGFILDTLPFQTSRTVYHNNLGWGLKYLNTMGVIGNTYTVQMYIRITNFNKFYTRIIDFSDGVADNGLYFTNYNTPAPSDQRCLNFFPNGNFGTCPFFNTETYYLLTITRNGTTKFMDVYVNNQLFTTFFDHSNMYVGVTGQPVHIFRDDPVGFACEDGEANIAYLSFANHYSTQADVSFIYQNINTIANPADFTFSQQSACAGKSLTITYAGNLPPTANQYMFQWDWNGANVHSGSDRGPYVITWPTPGTKTVTLTLVGSGCAASIINKKQIAIGQDVATVIDTSVCAGTAFEGYTTSGTYVDKFVTASGCDSTRTIHLTLRRCGIYFPNAFTPNKDGKNELFNVITDFALSEYRLTIYNRYGELVFQTSQPDVGWDGKHKGRDAPLGVYVWSCTLKMTAMQPLQRFKGTITLIR